MGRTDRSVRREAYPVAIFQMINTAKPAPTTSASLPKSRSCSMSIPLRPDRYEAALVRHAGLRVIWVSVAVRGTTHRSVVAGFQKRNRNPAVGAMLLRWRKPEANPPFTCVNMIPE